MTINERLFSIIEQKSIKSTDLCKYLNINSSVLSTWKKRGTSPSAENIIGICEFLNITPEFLLTGKESDNLSKDELEIIKLYRECDNTGKTAVKGLLKTLSKPEESEGKLSNSRIG